MFYRFFMQKQKVEVKFSNFATELISAHPFHNLFVRPAPRLHPNAWERCLRRGVWLWCCQHWTVRSSWLVGSPPATCAQWACFLLHSGWGVWRVSGMGSGLVSCIVLHMKVFLVYLVLWFSGFNSHGAKNIVGSPIKKYRVRVKLKLITWILHD